MLSDGANTFSWNARNQVATLNSVSLQYDAFGRRTKNLQNTSFLFDGANTVQELSGSTVTANLVGGGIDEFFTRSDSSGTFAPLTDALGSTIALVDGNGNVQTSYSYDPFGNTTVSGMTSANPSQYTGRENEGNGLYYYRARYYSPALGRFISEDPLDFAGSGPNLYAYVFNSPTNLIDPSGLRPGDKYPNLKCAGWHAILDINVTSRHRTPAWPNGREYGGWMYHNADGTYSYTAPAAGGAAGIQVNQFNPIPQGGVAAGDYHTHGAYDPQFNSQGINPGQPGYNWHHDGNEVFSSADKGSNEIEGPNNSPVPGFLGTPQGTTEEYIPLPGHPGQGSVIVLTKQHCGCLH